MESLNYHHLQYFWLITEEGGLAKAARRLRLTHSTLSSQLGALETYLGAPLFERRGRRLVLTEFGAEVAAYCADIFRLGGELLDMARGRIAGRRIPLRVGVVGALPKTVTARLLEAGTVGIDSGPIQMRQGTLEQMLQDLGASRLDLILSDAPPPAGLPLKVHAHVLGESEILVYGVPRLARRYRKGFPASLEGAPLLLPGPGTSLRLLIERWLADRGIRARIEGDFDDAGLLRVFGGLGRGLFPVRAVLRTEVDESHGGSYVGRMTGVVERYYAISMERRVRHPGVAAIIEAARARLKSLGRKADA